MQSDRVTTASTYKLYLQFEANSLASYLHSFNFIKIIDMLSTEVQPGRWSEGSPGACIDPGESRRLLTDRQPGADCFGPVHATALRLIPRLDSGQRP